MNNFSGTNTHAAQIRKLSVRRNVQLVLDLEDLDWSSTAPAASVSSFSSPTMSCISCGGMKPHGLRERRSTLLKTMHSICPSDSLSMNVSGSSTGDGTRSLRLSGKKASRSALNRPIELSVKNYERKTTHLTGHSGIASSVPSQASHSRPPLHLCC